MLRSLIAMIAAVIIGLTTVKFVEAAGAAGLAPEGGPDSGADAPSAAYQALLVAAWGAGAFAAALTALLLGRRWAPLGGLAAASVFLVASITILTFALSWVTWPAAAAATALGGFAAVRLLRASTALPGKRREREIFSD